MYYRRRQPVAKMEINDFNERVDSLITSLEGLDGNQGGVEFLKSLKLSYKKWNGLTEKQGNAFLKMEKRYSPEERKESEEWKKEYNDPKSGHRDTAKVISKYYLKYTDYYCGLSNSILNDNYIPKKETFYKMTDNKYSRMVLENQSQKPKYEVGSMVRMRSSNRNLNRKLGSGTDHTNYNNISEKVAIVIENDTGNYNSVVGGREYKVLVFDNVISVEERDIKQFRETKKN